MRVRLALALSIAALPLAIPPLARPALAQAQAQAQPNPEAVKHFQAGMAAFKIKDYQGAIAEWKIAESIEPSPGLYYNMAVAYKRLNDSANALAYYQKFLAAAPADDPDRADAQSNVQTLQQALAAQPSQGPQGGTAPQGPQGQQPPPPPPPNGGYAGGGYQNGGYQNGGYANGQPTYNAPPPGQGGGWSPGPPPGPPPVQAVAQGPLDNANLGLGVDIGPVFDLGVFTSQVFQETGLALALHLDLNLTHSFWLYGLIDYGQFSAKPGATDPTSGVSPSADYFHYGAGLTWAHFLTRDIYVAPSAGVGLGTTSYYPSAGDTSTSANYNNVALFLDGSFYFVLGQSELRLTPISLDVFMGNTYDPSSSAPDAPAGYVNGGGATYSASIGYTYLY